jgi:hypothetical protein
VENWIRGELEVRRVDCSPTRSVVPRPGRCQGQAAVALAGVWVGRLPAPTTGKVVRCRRQLVASGAAAGVREVSLQLRRRNADSVNKAKSLSSASLRDGRRKGDRLPGGGRRQRARRVSVTFRTVVM